MLYYLEFNCFFDLTPSRSSCQESPNRPSPLDDKVGLIMIRIEAINL